VSTRRKTALATSTVSTATTAYAHGPNAYATVATPNAGSISNPVQNAP